MTTRQRDISSRTMALAGATGMVGCYRVGALLARGDWIIVLMRQASPNDSSPGAVTHVRGRRFISCF